jgi:hypothetical protein
MPKATNQKPQRRSIAPKHRRQIIDLLARFGLRRSAEQVGVHAQTLATLAAGVQANGSTVALVERRLAEISANEVEAAK